MVICHFRGNRLFVPQADRTELHGLWFRLAPDWLRAVVSRGSVMATGSHRVTRGHANGVADADSGEAVH